MSTRIVIVVLARTIVGSGFGFEASDFGFTIMSDSDSDFGLDCARIRISDLTDRIGFDDKWISDPTGNTLEGTLLHGILVQRNL